MAGAGGEGAGHRVGDRGGHLCPHGGLCGLCHGQGGSSYGEHLWLDTGYEVQKSDTIVAR